MRIKLGQIGIGHNHAEGKMLAAQKFPELFEVIGYAEPDEEWVKKGVCLRVTKIYRDSPLMRSLKNPMSYWLSATCGT